MRRSSTAATRRDATFGVQTHSPRGLGQTIVLIGMRGAGKITSDAVWSDAPASPIRYRRDCGRSAGRIDTARSFAIWVKKVSAAETERLQVSSPVQPAIIVPGGGIILERRTSASEAAGRSGVAVAARNGTLFARAPVGAKHRSRNRRPTQHPARYASELAPLFPWPPTFASHTNHSHEEVADLIRKRR